ncbi:AAA family ATPase [Salisediminibacterium halotolerans]|uniref:AAA family ATPase n=1 Tax=Salisediminibacterium halotolerans TaxID=517425 RepID=UPI000EAC762B|nr:AAA family ATPase [Salisediminibacterium halotolerans]RLJ78369.1 putative ATPase [Actinophytocola xinjiangensis]RPE88289.1 putative ATPase [Salisediminibacterium halotolerans]TWG37345.1 putative ATPase [Salisediminibacterium halotolerans]GEL06810.1 ATPase AAA [Salisediminibacterium halotolerans]
MDLFTTSAEQNPAPKGPLAARMRPRTIDEVIGQEDILAPGTLLHRAITADRLTPMIFHGPPGTGKTTLARVIANTTASHFEQLNAVTAGIKDVREVVEAAKGRLKYEERKTVLFIDEIHRFNKGQQDALLPYVEDGTVVLIGATTENPMFEVNPALLSRSRLFKLEPLTDEEVKRVIEEAVTDQERGFGDYDIHMHDDAVRHIVDIANGDARTALNAVELAVLTTDPDPDETITVDLQTAEASIQQRMVRYDKGGDNHYDTISAFIKSIRGSDPDAVLYWLAKMIYAGEDPRFIARRLYVHAAEDVGLADPNALLIAEAAFHAVEFIGMPEARIPLAEAALYLATAPKSNAVITGIDNALATVKNERTGDVPVHLRDSHYKGAGKLGHGDGYLYPHHYENHYVVQQYLPDHLQHKTFYSPSANGYEKTVQKRLDYFNERIQNNKRT